MSTEEITITLEKRDQVRKGLNKLRNKGQLPAVIHDPGQKSIIVSGPYLDMMRVYHQAGKHHPVYLKVGDNTYFTIIKDVDFEPTKHLLRHVVFDIIKQTEKVETEVPIVFIGEDAPAQKAGLLIIRQLDHLDIEALPRDLPDEIEVSQESLIEVGDKITVADLKLPVGVTVLTEPEHPIAVVEEPKAAEPEEVEEATAPEEATSEAATESSEEE